MKHQVFLKVVGSSNKILFERAIPQCVEFIPYSNLIDSMDCLFKGIPHTILFQIDCIESVK